MSRLQFILVALLALLSASETCGEERPQHHFLFIVDNSISMAQHKTAAVKMVRDVITSGFEGQIETGDSIDIWTYDTATNLRGFPPQIWQPADAEEIAATAANYLQDYSFSGRSDFGRVAADLGLLVPETKSLLVVIITDGEKPFSGISLDLEINGYLAKKNKLGPSKGPFLVSLAAINGALRTWTAYFGEGRVDLATLPERNKPAHAVAQVKQQTPQPRPQRIARPTPIEPETPLIPSRPADAANRFIFNYPPGTRITPVTASAGTGSRAVPNALGKMDLGNRTIAKQSVASSAPKVATGSTNTSTAAVTNPTLNVRATNVATAAVAFGAVQTNAAAPAKLIANAQTNKSSLAAVTNIITNAIAITAATKPAENRGNVASNNVIAKTKAKVTPTKQGFSARASVKPIGTLHRAIYLSGATGVACVGIGLFLLVRKLRRPSQSIISRSLLQR